jgi:hypothetical protein
MGIAISDLLKKDSPYLLPSASRAVPAVMRPYFRVTLGKTPIILNTDVILRVIAATTIAILLLARLAGWTGLTFLERLFVILKETEIVILTSYRRQLSLGFVLL